MRQLIRSSCVGALTLVVVAVAPLDTSPPVHATTPAAPIAPEVLRPGGTSGTTATVRWTRPLTGASPTSYVVHAIPHDGDPTTTTPALTTTLAAGDRAPTTVLTGLSPGVPYDVTVTSVGPGGSTTAVANPTTWLPSPSDGLALWLDVSHPDTRAIDGAQLASLVDRSSAGNDVNTVTQPWSATGGYRGRAVTWGFPGLTTGDTAVGSLTVNNHPSLEHQGSYTVVMALHQTTAIYPMYAQFLFKGDYLPQLGDCYPTQYQLAKFDGSAEFYGYHGRDGSGCSSFSRTGVDGIRPVGDQVVGRRVSFDASSGMSTSAFLKDSTWDPSQAIAGRTPNANANLAMRTPHMSETLLFTTALDDATVSAIRAYLAAKAPLPAPTVSAVTPRADGFDVAFSPGHDASLLAAGRYQVSLDGGVTWMDRPEGFADSPLRISGLAPNSVATVSVRAVSSAGIGAASTPVTARVPAPPPDVSMALPLTTQPVATTTTTPAATPTPVPLTAELLAALPESVVLSAEITRVRRGDSMTLRGDGFDPGDMVQAVMASEIRVLSTAAADADGVVTIEGTVPLDVSSGPHTVALYSPATGRGLRQDVTVIDDMTPAEETPIPAPTANELPVTGGAVGAGPVAMMLLIAGLGLTVTARRRTLRRHAQAGPPLSAAGAHGPPDC